MRLEAIATINARVGGGYKQRTLFITPNGTRVVRLGRDYFPVSRDGRVQHRIRYLGREDNFEVWEVQNRNKSVKMIEIR